MEYIVLYFREVNNNSKVENGFPSTLNSQCIFVCAWDIGQLVLVNISAHFPPKLPSLVKQQGLPAMLVLILCQ